MTDDSTPQFDPRFSPEFQPGYSAGDSAPAFAAPAPATPAPQPKPQSQPSAARPPVGLAPQGTAYPVAPTEPTRSAARRNAPAAPGVVSAPSPVVTGASSTGGWPSDSSAVVSTEQTDAFGAEGSAPSLGAQVRNPFLLVLGVIAAALVIVGSWMFAQAYSAFSDTGNFASPADFVALESAMRAAPIVILAGVGVAVAVLFIFARTWRPRR